MEVQMKEGTGPHFPDPLVTPVDIEKLNKVVNVNKELGYVFDAITMTRHALKGEVPLIGFCGAPWTLFAYMIEGGGSRTFQKAKTWIFRYPEESKKLLQRIADVCVDFLVGQVKAGAQVFIFVVIVNDRSFSHTNVAFTSIRLVGGRTRIPPLPRILLPHSPTYLHQCKTETRS